MLSAHEKLQIAAWKAETEAAKDRVHGEDAPKWLISAAYHFFCERERRLEKAERKGQLVDAQIAHCLKLRALGESKRADILDKTIDEYFERELAA
ncbi:hypothetical protein FIU86_04355 [Roseovarius sp. THAF9]|uniref:hypothetical protein n=1 Tax=Roseovarius sp. THAF9 TaxID=2587847 RepID=UPI00126868AA|nr:hypothetical protein [Roseovarius sp. THAF9]QFT92063.1 hypothetical protein FIU86_04355 [Roseovarius sp. THAF9]